MNVIIIGGGQVGEYLTKLLLENKCSVRVIEKREDVLAKLEREIPKNTIIAGNGTDPTVLESAGIAKADVVVAVTGEDEANLVAATIAKFEFNIPRVIARVNNPQNAWLFNSSMGVDACINQADLMAHLVVEEIDLKNMLTLLKTSRGNYSIVKLQADENSAAVNKTLMELELPAKALIIAVYHGNEVIIPHGDTVISGGDSIMAFADGDAQIKINEIFGAKK